MESRRSGSGAFNKTPAWQLFVLLPPVPDRSLSRTGFSRAVSVLTLQRNLERERARKPKKCVVRKSGPRYLNTLRTEIFKIRLCSADKPAAIDFDTECPSIQFGSDSRSGETKHRVGLGGEAF